MDIYVYTDESGVFDKNHEDTYVFGGVIFLNAESKDNAGRKYLHAERTLRTRHSKYRRGELKACILENSHKGDLFRSLNKEIRFAIVIKQKKVLDRIFNHKKDKQRYLDYVYKVGLKKVFIELDQKGVLNLDHVNNLRVYNDEHTTATNGKYELREALESEFKHGTYNQEWNKFYPPIFKNLRAIDLQYCNSAKKPHIRMADIIANKAYYLARTGQMINLRKSMITIVFP